MASFIGMCAAATGVDAGKLKMVLGEENAAPLHQTVIARWGRAGNVPEATAEGKKELVGSAGASECLSRISSGTDEAGDRLGFNFPFCRDGAWYGVGKTKPLTIKIFGWRVKTLKTPPISY